MAPADLISFVFSRLDIVFDCEKRRAPRPSFWELYKEGLGAPAAYLLRDATIVLIAIAANAIVLLASKGFEAIGAPAWFTVNLDRIDLGSALINVGILAIDTAFKLSLIAFGGDKQ